MKIIKKPKFKPQTCSLCGCVFKFNAKDIRKYEKGGPIEPFGFAVPKEIIITKVVCCPICHNPNEVDLNATE